MPLLDIQIDRVVAAVNEQLANPSLKKQEHFLAIIAYLAYQNNPELPIEPEDLFKIIKLLPRKSLARGCEIIISVLISQGTAQDFINKIQTLDKDFVAILLETREFLEAKVLGERYFYNFFKNLIQKKSKQNNGLSDLDQIIFNINLPLYFRFKLKKFQQNNFSDLTSEAIGEIKIFYQLIFASAWQGLQKLKPENFIFEEVLNYFNSALENNNDLQSYFCAMSQINLDSVQNFKVITHGSFVTKIKKQQIKSLAKLLKVTYKELSDIELDKERKKQSQYSTVKNKVLDIICKLRLYNCLKINDAIKLWQTIQKIKNNCFEDLILKLTEGAQHSIIDFQLLAVLDQAQAEKIVHLLPDEYKKFFELFKEEICKLKNLSSYNQLLIQLNNQDSSLGYEPTWLDKVKTCIGIEEYAEAIRVIDTQCHVLIYGKTIVEQDLTDLFEAFNLTDAQEYKTELKMKIDEYVPVLKKQLNRRFDSLRLQLLMIADCSTAYQYYSEKNNDSQIAASFIEGVRKFFPSQLNHFDCTVKHDQDNFCKFSTW